MTLVERGPFKRGSRATSNYMILVPPSLFDTSLEENSI